MKQNNRHTKSEMLFEEFCRNASIPFQKINVDVTQTPDYDIMLSGHLVVTEVKQFDINDDDKKIIDLIERDGIASTAGGHANRVRNKIDSAKTQLKIRAQNTHPSLLVLYDNVPIKPVNIIDIKQAMYGEEINRIRQGNGWRILSVDGRFGKKSRFTSNQNTIISSSRKAWTWFNWL